MLRTHSIAEADVYEILSNPRRRAALRAIAESGSGVDIPLSSLADDVAAAEAGTSPAPPSVRRSVYNSLHQTHLPMLADLDVVGYDRETRTVVRRDRVQDVERYMEVVSAIGVSWSEVYRTLGVVTLALVTASLAGLEPVSVVDPLLWASGSLVAFAGTIAAQLHANRSLLRRAFGE